MNFTNHAWYNCEILLDDGTKYRVDANWLHNQKLDHWQGWECDVGNTRIFIDSDLSVYGGECMNDKLGDADQDWQLLEKSTICKKTRCTGCTDDLLIYKKEKL